MIGIKNEYEYTQKIIQAMKSNDDNALAIAIDTFRQAVTDTIKEDYEAVKQSNDSAILAQRGHRQITSQERSGYTKIISALKSDTPKQAFVSIVGTDTELAQMFTTIVEDVYKELAQEHPLLAAINFQSTGYLTRWVLQDCSAQTAYWGAITDAINHEVTGAFKVVDLKQSKLSAFAAIEKSMLDMGPEYLDTFIRKCLYEYMLVGMENGCVNGSGVNGEPIGLIKDIHTGVTVNTNTGYPDKETISVSNFKPQTYGDLVNRIAINENGKVKKLGKISLICNQTDFLTKIMPATTTINANGHYVNGVFPYPTDVIISNAVEDNKAILAHLPEYFLGIGSSKEGIIYYDDSVNFFEDQRAFKIVQYATGRAYDNTTAIYLDITNLAPADIEVRINGVVQTQSNETEQDNENTPTI